MPTLLFTQNLQRHVKVGPCDVAGSTVGQALDAVFAREPKLRGYILDDQGAVRHHVVVFVDGEPIRDRKKLTDPVQPDSEVYVAQALSGG